MTWQPIETAPRDGTVILVVDASMGDVSVAKWDGLRQRARWQALADGRSAIESQSDFGTEYIEPCPTHWQPLPPPPREGGGDE